jgi:hypothetical protein
MLSVVFVLRSAVTLARGWRTLAAELPSELRSAVDNISNPYRPELCYMRGPGPKWQKKHYRDGARLH